jgi:hypothetical protein
MKKINNILLLSLIAVVLSVSSCSDFLNVNTDPNRVTADNVTPALIFTQVENSMANRQALRFVFLDNWMGYWARSGTFAVNKDEVTYKLPSTDASILNLWQRDYDILFDLYQVRTKAIAANDSVLAGASIVLSAELWQEQVDMFGASPYTQSFDYVKYPRPAYDKAADIYADLLVQLDKAITYLNATIPSSGFLKADIIFARNGDKANLPDYVNSWKKLANTIKLRIYLRQSEKGFVPTGAQLAKITTDGGLFGVGENVSVQPGYSNATDKQNPFFSLYGLTPSGAPASSDNKANNYFIGILGSTDARLDRFYKAPVVGTDYGALNGNIIPGGDPIIGSDIGPGLANNPAQDQWLIPSYESLFFQAEASARGWVVSASDTRTLFENAVKESFKALGVADSAASYIANVPSADWTNAGTTKNDQVKFIVYQKYLALNGVDPLEAWSDLRRLGSLNYLPAGYLSNSPDLTATHLPYVLPYPQSEYTTNSVNVPPRTIDGTFTEKLFWQP